MAKPEHKNNFDFLRLFAALCVLFGHSYLLLGRLPEEPFRRLVEPIQAPSNWYAPSIGLYIFFLISGYLVTQSYERNPKKYLPNRILRIFPALIVNVLLAVFIIGAFFTTLPVSEYFHDKLTYQYLMNALALPYLWHLPGLFTNNIEHTANAPLWTLGHEILLYLVVMMAGISRVPLRLGIPVLIAAALILKSRGIEFFGLNTANMQLPILPYIDLALFFLIGSAAYLFVKKYDWRLLIFLSAVAIVLYYFGFKYISVYVVFPYAVFFFAFHPAIKLGQAARHGDFSYGIYIYGYLVQQIIIQSFNNHITPLVLFLSSTAVSLAFAYMSWHLIEKRALAFKAK